jgi:diacylglycerol kinase family enzyme
VRISLVHNPTAGGGQEVDDFVSLLTEAGHEVQHRSSKDDWESLLQDPGELVVAAGGDGTVRKVALAASDLGLRVAMLPIGTANNIAKTLGMLGDARELVASWSADQPLVRGLDVGEVAGAAGTQRFVEALGGGMVAELIRRGAEVEDDAKLLGRETDRALHLLADMLREAPPLPWRISADGVDLSGDHLAVEVLNIRFVGPNVPFAPDADPSDGLLDVVVVGEDDREPMLAYLENRLHLASGTMPSLRTARARHVELVVPAGVRLHVDDSLWPTGDPLAEPMSLEVRSRAASVTLLGVGEAVDEPRT